MLARELSLPGIAPASGVVIGGVDTHEDLHVVAVIGTGGTMIATGGTMIATGSLSPTRARYRALLKWMRSHGDVRLAGIEGTGSYGKGLTRHLLDAGVEVTGACRPGRTGRRRRGKPGTPRTPRTPPARR